MAQIISSAAFNPAALQLDDVYIVVTPPPSFINGVPSDVGAVVGTASWGPLNTALNMGSPADLASNFGAMGVPALADVHDMATEVALAFTQANGLQGTLEIWGVRVSDGTDAKASGAMNDNATPTPALGATIQALYTGILGNNISIIVSAGGLPNTYSVAVVAFNGGISEIWPNIPNPSPGTFWTNLQSAFATGISSVRGPSQLVRVSALGSSTNPPGLQTVTLSGGTDGRSGVTSSILLGSDTALPKTGCYALRSLTPAVGVGIVAGLTDSSIYSEIEALADSEGILWLGTFPTGTSTATAITNKNSIGIVDYNWAYFKDFVYFYDPANAVTRLTDPLGVAMGSICTLNPSISPSNKPVFGINGTERYNTVTGQIQSYSTSEAGQLEAAGINIITNPVPGGAYFGFRMGVNSTANSVTGPIEYSRMTNWLARTFASQMGQFVGQNQSTQPNDPLRNAVTTTLNGFLQILANENMIDSYQVICGFQNNNNSPAAGYNTPQTISQHYLYALVLVRYLASVKFFVISLQGGTTVVTVQNSLNQAPAGQ